MSDYYTTNEIETADAMDTLRQWFPEGRANNLNFVIFSTSGVHGTHHTIEDSEASWYAVPVTFLLICPRTVKTYWGNCLPQTPDDFDFLKRLRASSREVLAGFNQPPPAA